MTTTERAMSPDEREFLATILRTAYSPWRRFHLGAVTMLTSWAAEMLAFVIVWALGSWLVRLASGRDYGWQNPQAIWIVAIASVICAIRSVVLTFRWFKISSISRSELTADLEGAVVLDESYQFVDAKRFQEPEHGGLLYFLRTVDRKVFVMYDCESRDLGAGGGDPLSSSFRPCVQLTIARAPKSRFVLSEIFSGDVLNVQEPIELALPPKEWPKEDEFCKTPWHDIDRRFGGGRPSVASETVN